MSRLETIPLDLDGWGLTSDEATPVRYRGRDCLRFADGALSPAAPNMEIADGVLEADLLVSPARAFHGLAWRVRGHDFESFFVRPHQSGNPDAIQYTPVSHGISSWQLYHGPGFWAPITIPIDAWFTMRIAFTGARADMYVDDLAVPVLSTRLLQGAGSGGVALQVGGPGLHVARVAASRGPVELVGALPPEAPPWPGTIRRWEVSDAFPEAAIAGATVLPAALAAGRSWTALAAEPGGLADLARVNGIEGDRNTVLARASIHAAVAGSRSLELGFSDRAIVFVNGRAVFRADDAYRTRDYRFLGSIGYWYTLHLDLVAGANELVIAVSEDVGGWGVQARFADEGVAPVG
jgi:hypothetical protein